jgi:hypothetical protein
MRRRTLALGAVILLALALLPERAAAQLGGVPGFGGGGPSWSPFVGVRGGWAIKDESPSLGAYLELPIPIPLLRPTLAAGGDLLFQEGLRERLATLDLTVHVQSSLYAGGGPAVMDTYFGASTTREREVGFTLVAGIRGRVGRLSNNLEIRTVRVDSRKPTLIMFGLSYPLFGLLGF